LFSGGGGSVDGWYGGVVYIEYGFMME